MNKSFLKFKEFHLSNPMVYELFKRFSFEAINNNHKHLSVAMIIERIRWETTVSTNDLEFKINNNHKPYYARLFMSDCPIYKGFFRTKEMDHDVDEMVAELARPNRQYRQYNQSILL